MARFVQGSDRHQVALLPDCLDDYVGVDNPVRVVDVIKDELDLAALGFAGVVPASTGRPGYHPATLLKLYLYGYLNQVASSRRLEREASGNVEVMWLTGQLAPDHKTIADFRRDNGPAIQAGEEWRSGPEQTRQPVDENPDARRQVPVLWVEHPECHRWRRKVLENGYELSRRDLVFHTVARHLEQSQTCDPRSGVDLRPPHDDLMGQRDLPCPAILLELQSVVLTAGWDRTAR